MKKQLAGVLLTVATLLYAEPEWVDYDTALKSATKEGKIVMVMLSQEGCDACWYMDEVVFEDDDVISELQMDFIPVHFDVKRDTLPKPFSYIGTPTFYFLNAEGKKIERLNGAANVKDFTNVMRDVKAKVKLQKVLK